MRTTGMFLADTPLPDGRIPILPNDFVGGSITVATSGPGVLALQITGAATTTQAFAPGVMLRYGMSDDAQQQYGKGAPSGGFQGAQGQPVSTLTPFTTPYGPSGRPPFPANAFGQIASPNGRPKGLKPVAVTLAYTVSTSALTAFQISLIKSVYNVGIAPTISNILAPTNLPLQVANMQIITSPIPIANQNFLADPFSQLSVVLGVTAGSAALSIFGAWIDVAFNYN